MDVSASKSTVKIWMWVFIATTVILLVVAITAYMKYVQLQKDITKATTKTANPSPAVISATVANIQSQANAISATAN